LTSVQTAQAIASGALGRVGNLAFRGEAGATPRASGPNIFQRIGRALANLAYRVAGNPAQRARRDLQNQVRDNSRGVGNLLGRLTAPNLLESPKARQALTAELISLAARSGGNLSRLPGGSQALAQYVRQLSPLDRSALAEGALFDEWDRDDLLLRIDQPLRDQAEQVLDQIKLAVNLEQTLGQLHEAVVSSDMGRIARQSSALSQIVSDARTRFGPLPPQTDRRLSQIDLAVNLERARDALRQAVASGDRGQIVQQLSLLGQSAAEADVDALPAAVAGRLRTEVGQAVNALRGAHEPQLGGPLTRATFEEMDDAALHLLRNAHARLEPYGLAMSLNDALTVALERARGALRQAVASGDRGRIAGQLSSLERFIQFDEKGVRALSADVAEHLGAEVRSAVSVLRGGTDINKSTPLTWASFAGMDDATLRLLGNMGDETLQQYGLAMSPRDARAELARRAPPLDANPAAQAIATEHFAPHMVLTDEVRKLPAEDVNLGSGAAMPVATQFMLDANRGNQLSVRGTGRDGRQVDAPWPEGNFATPAARRTQINQALGALRDVADSDDVALALTRIMQQQFGAGILMSLHSMAVAGTGPFKLDGQILIPIGGPDQSYVIEKMGDGSFRLDVSYVFRGSGGNGWMDAQGQPVYLDPQSWAEVKVSVQIAPDGQSITKVIGPPEFRADIRAGVAPPGA